MLNALRNVFANHAAVSSENQVIINVYDMLPSNFLTNFGYFALGIGVYHSGIEIAGKEYCFGGHDYPEITGVFEVEPKVGPPGVVYKQSIPMGPMNIPLEQLDDVIEEISKVFLGPTYNLLERNCNHFTDELCRRLTGKPAPQWINRAAKIGTMFPCVIPSEWIEPPEMELDQDSENLPSMTSETSYTQIDQRRTKNT